VISPSGKLLFEEQAMPTKNAAGGMSTKAGKPTRPVTKTDAIDLAMRELGKKASTQDLLGYAQQKFGLTITPQHLSVIKSTLKKRRKSRRAKQADLAAINGEGIVRRRRQERDISVAESIAIIREVKVLARKAGGMAVLKQLVEALSE
jgi:hypothetical protein